MKLSFHGAAREVTGSCILLETGGAKILIDCGMFQGERMCGTKNKDEFGFDPSTIDAVFVTHPHADHTGRLPKLIDGGFTGPIYLTEPARALTRIVLEDAHDIMVDNAKRCGDEILYTREDLDGVLAQTQILNYHNTVVVGDCSVMLHDAGHVLGSAYVSVDAEGKRLVFSGDIGNDDVPILSDTEPISRADIVVCESTYGHRLHEPIQTRTKKLKDAVVKTLEAGGVLLIPAFSIERTQELLYELNGILPSIKKKVPIYLDSPLAIRATEIYREYKNYLHFDAPILAEADRDFFSFPTLHETLATDASKAINDAPSPKIIIAGSGMMTGGRILHHLTRYLPDPKSTLLIIGYQAQGTLGRLLYEGAKEVKIYHERVPVRCQMMAIGAFSAHGDQAKLTRWLHPTDGTAPKKIFLVHGDPETKEVFATHLREALKTDVVIPQYHEAFEL